MRNRFLPLISPRAERLIATFGQARLVSLPKGRLEVRGGRPEDRTAAKEWISLFMHEAVPKFAE